MTVLKISHSLFIWLVYFPVMVIVFTINGYIPDRLGGEMPF